MDVMKAFDEIASRIKTCTDLTSLSAILDDVRTIAISTQDPASLNAVMRRLCDFSRAFERLGDSEAARTSCIEALQGFSMLGDPNGYTDAFALLVTLASSSAPPFIREADAQSELKTTTLELLRAWIAFARPPEDGDEASLRLRVGPQELERLLSGAAHRAWETPHSPRHEWIRAYFIARLRNTPPHLLPIVKLEQRLALHPLETWIILLLRLSETDPLIRRAFSHAYHDLSQDTPDLAFFSGLLLGPKQAIWPTLTLLTSPTSTLGRFNLISIQRGKFRQRCLYLSDACNDFLDSPSPDLSSDLSAWCKLYTQPDALSPPQEGEIPLVIQRWSRDRAAFQSHKIRIVIRGSSARERERYAKHAALSAEKPFISADLTEFIDSSHHTLSLALAALAREALLHDALTFLHLPQPEPSQGEDEKKHGRHILTALSSSLDLFATPIFLGASPTSEPFIPEIDGILDFELRLPSPTEQANTWRQTLSDFQLPCPPHEQLNHLSQRFPLGLEDIHRVIADVSLKARLTNLPPAWPDILACASRTVQRAMSTIAQRIPASFNWNDVVLDPDTLEQLQEIVTYARHRKKVLDDWGFRKKLPYGRALSALFWGQPGTGKTMMASIIAREIGMELFRVDISQLVSKYIGETEKNLARAFDEATRNNAVLLFDEADSLFSKRTEVKSSNDRYANLEVNFLLQKMESFEGVTILTTNFEASIDDAFRRRIRFKIQFPFPDTTQRAFLWQSMFPDSLVFDKESVDFRELGEEFKLSGGNIKEAVLRAAFIAAERETPITHEVLWEAATRVHRSLGHLARDDH